MIQWTESAQAAWKAHEQQLQDQLQDSEADASEVAQDVRCHIEEEARKAELQVIDATWLQSILKRMEDQSSSPAQKAIPNSQSKLNFRSSLKHPDAWSKFRWGALWLTAVIWPTITLLFELSTRLCSGYWFDPMPTPLHVLLLCLVPLGNGWGLRKLGKDPASIGPWLGRVVAFNTGTSLLYTLMFAPAIPISFLLTIVYGMGLLPLTPLVSFLTGLRLWKHVRAAQAQPSRHWTLAWGMLAAFVCLLALESPYFLTRLGLRWADAEDRSVQIKGIRLLRALGHEETMLTACYQRPRRVFDLSSWLTQSKETVTQQDARAIYYRVTGRPFNAVKPPKLYTSQGRWSLVEDAFTWELDDALGGSSVAGRVMGLEMVSSRIDSRIETHGANSYTEWTMEFENKAPLAREARAQIRLPVGGVVSRLTLWVNDEEREAAFASRNTTRQAYQKIAVERRRDPVLVTTSGPDQILMQCFPVPPNGGRMKIRFGITAPLDMRDIHHGRTRLPVMVERNFNLRGTLKHAIWVESRSLLASDHKDFKASQHEDGDQILQGQLSDRALLSAQSTIEVERAQASQKVFTPARQPQESILQELSKQSAQAPKSIIWVVDGSHAMGSHISEITQALQNWGSDIALQVIIASDQSPFIAPDHAYKVFSRQEAMSYLSMLEPSGGQDNLAALTQAWALAREKGVGHVWWWHGPQPVMLGDPSSLQQQMERSRGSIQLISKGIFPAPNRILENLDSNSTRILPHYGNLQETWQHWLDQASGKAEIWGFHRRAIPSSQIENTSLPQVSQHIERLWAKQEVLNLIARRDQKQAIALASEHQLVTPVTGAVVLETQEQYDEMGLTPVAFDAVPSIPEPSTWALWCLGLMLVVWGQHRSKQFSKNQS